MKLNPGLGEQVKRVSSIMLVIWLIYLLITGLIIGVGFFVHNIPVADFTREPNVTLDGAFYVGAVPNLGIILWAAAATLCFMGTGALNRYYPASLFRMFLLHAGIFSTLLLLDDLYQVHEVVFPGYLHISQKIIYLVYLGYALFFLIKFREVIYRTEYIILFVSISLLSLSILVDFIHDSEKLSGLLKKVTGFNIRGSENLRILLEDTFKGLGILTWLIYFSRVTIINVLSSIKNSGKQIPIQK